MEALFNSFLLVALSEMGDKTQLLALILAARFRKPWAIMSGIFVATILNHGLASQIGGVLASRISPDTLKWILFLAFTAFALWILVPDKDDDLKLRKTGGAFLTTAILFFLAEMGDKTQLATLALGANYQNAVSVTLGTTCGMLLSDGLAVFYGSRLIKKLSMNWIRRLAAVLFVLFGVAILLF